VGLKLLLVDFLQEIRARKLRQEKRQTYQGVANGRQGRLSPLPTSTAAKFGETHSILQSIFSKSCDFNSLRYILQGRR
jgi:hypothetical protein